MKLRRNTDSVTECTGKKERSKARRVFAAAGRYAAAALSGFAITFAASDIARPQEPTSQPAEEAAAVRLGAEHISSVSRDEQLLRLIDALPRPVDEKHPTRVPIVQVVADNILRMDEVLRLLHGSRPLEGDPMCKVYDTAIKTLEEGKGTEGAVQYLERAICGAFENLASRAKSLEDLGPYTDDLRTMLQRIRKGMKDDIEKYIGFRPAQSDITALWRLYGGWEPAATVSERDKPAVSQGFPNIERQRFLHPNYHPITNWGDELMQPAGGQETPTLVRVFGGDAALAKSTVEALRNGLATVRKYPNDSRRIAEAARNLHNLLKQIPDPQGERENREIYPDFNSAMDELGICATNPEVCKLKEALRFLLFGNETAFNAGELGLTDLYVVSVRQMAVPLLSIHTKARFPWRSHERRFQRCINLDDGEGCSWSLLSVDAGLSYEHLAMGGQIQQFRVELDQQGELVIRRVNTAPLSQGIGHVGTVRPSLRLGSSIAGKPMELEIFPVSFGYRYWKVGANIVPEGGEPTGSVTIGDDGVNEFFWGFWGVEARFPYPERSHGRPRLERVGIGAVDYRPHPHPLVYADASLLYKPPGRTRLQGLLGLNAAYLLKRPRVGGALVPLDVVYQVSEELALQASLGARYEAVFHLSHNDYAGERVPTAYSHIVDPSVSLGMWFKNGSGISLRGGYIMQFGGPEEERLPARYGPGAPYVMTYFTFPLW